MILLSKFILKNKYNKDIENLTRTIKALEFKLELLIIHCKITIIIFNKKLLII